MDLLFGLEQQRVNQYGVTMLFRKYTMTLNTNIALHKLSVGESHQTLLRTLTIKINS